MLPAFAETLQTPQPLQGQVTTTDTAPLELTEEQLNSFLGVWKVEIPKIRRKPTVTITSVSAKQVAGTYKGLLGTFPLWGSYQAETGEVRLFVDFSRSSLARMTRRSDKAIAQMTGKVDIAERTIIGSASLPEFSNRIYAFNGRKTN
ncbi:hypothetical protein BH11CYA1_BH11CYA1_08770 [soil metagenome]